MRRKEFNLWKPIWNGGRPHIGIADFRMDGADEMAVTIDYRNKHGDKSHPGKFVMSTAELRKYPVQVVGSGVRLHVAPMSDFKKEEE